MRKCLGLMAALAVVVGMCGRGHAADVLTGVTRSACEALLCLSTGSRPGECSPGLSVYYGIHGATPADTAALRMAFLMSCPTGGGAGLGNTGGGSAESAGAYMSESEKRQLVEVIVHGESGVNVTRTPQPFIDSEGNTHLPNWHTVVDTRAGTLYRNHPNIVDVPDNRGLYINGQKATQQGGKVFVGDTEYRMNQYRQYVPAQSMNRWGGSRWGRSR